MSLEECKRSLEEVKRLRGFILIITTPSITTKGSAIGAPSLIKSTVTNSSLANPYRILYHSLINSN